MRGRTPAPIPPAPRKTLLEWIEHDDGDTTGPDIPACSQQARTLHQRLLPDQAEIRSHPAEPLQPPPGLRLAPLG